MKHKVFVGGPIMYAMRSDVGFHAQTRRVIEGVLSAVMAAGYEVLSAHQLERWGETDMIDAYFDVCRRDFAWMREAAAFVAILPPGGAGEPIRTDGTCVELGWATALSKPIVLVRRLLDRHSHLVRGLPTIARVAELDFDVLTHDTCAVTKALAHFLERVD